MKKDYIEINNEVTLRSLETNRTPEIKKLVIERLMYVYNMCMEYLKLDMKILDLGCKDGLMFDLFNTFGFEHSNLVGVDCSKKCIEMVKNNGYAAFESDVQSMPFFKDNSFDFIFMIHTLEHVPEPEKVVAECRRLLKNPGYVFVEVPIQSQIDAPQKWGHYHPFVYKQQIKDLFFDFEILDERSQDTPSKSPWYRVLFRRI